MTRALLTMALAGTLLVLAPAVTADHIAFHGAIVDTGCRLLDQRLACPPGRAPDARLQRFDTAEARQHVRAALLDYAMRRDPDPSWRLIEVTWR